MDIERQNFLNEIDKELRNFSEGDLAKVIEDAEVILTGFNVHSNATGVVKGYVPMIDSFVLEFKNMQGEPTTIKIQRKYLVKVNFSKSSRETAMNWWNSMTFEEKFFKTIKHNDLIAGDKTRHPNTLTGREIEEIYKAEKKI